MHSERDKQDLSEGVGSRPGDIVPLPSVCKQLHNSPGLQPLVAGLVASAVHTGVVFEVAKTRWLVGLRAIHLAFRAPQPGRATLSFLASFVVVCRARMDGVKVWHSNGDVNLISVVGRRSRSSGV